jgi:hypothetical protein
LIKNNLGFLVNWKSKQDKKAKKLSVLRRYQFYFRDRNPRVIPQIEKDIPNESDFKLDS